MIHSGKFTVVLDACVLYPAPVRDLILSLSAEGLFTPKWSDIIQEEWTRNLLVNRLDLSKGVAFVKVIVPSKKETEIKGMITILNKSGIPLTREWNHHLKILKKQ